MAPRVSDAIKEDHRELEQYYERITQSSDQDEQTRYQNLFTWELARHSIGEELVIYPALEKHVANGKALAEKDRKEHQSVSLYRINPTKTNKAHNRIGQGAIEEVPESQGFRRRLHPYARGSDEGSRAAYQGGGINGFASLRGGTVSGRK